MNKLTNLVKEFLKILYRMELSNSGKEFHPNQIVSCRTEDHYIITNLLTEINFLTHQNNWIKVKDELPVIPKDSYGVSVIVAVFDPCYDEIDHGDGYSVYSAMWGYFNGSKHFLELCTCDEPEWIPIADTVTHWMYMPISPEYDPEVLNPIFKHYHENSYPKSELKQI